MSSYEITSSYVNRIAHRNGAPPRVSAATRAFAAAEMVHNGLLGVSTITQAVALTGSSRPSVEAALTILQSEDENLVDAVLGGGVSLARAAAQVKRRARLIASFRSAQPEDRIAFGQAVGVAEVFDSVCAPAL